MKNKTSFVITVFLTYIITFTHTQAASFDCARAGTKIEKLICSNDELSKLDDELGKKYSKTLKMSWSKEVVPHDQKVWLKERNSCKDLECLRNSYQKRINELRSPYQLVMNKDPELCKSILDIYNRDMDLLGRIDYDSHKIFSEIEWTPESDLNLSHAVFDINNDGKKELVIETTAGFHGIENDTFYIFPAESDVLAQLKPGQGGWKPLFEANNQFFSIHNNLYHLRELPPSQAGAISVYFIMHPFIWEGVSYISITDIAPQWIAISKYIKAEELQDVCYFFNKNIKPWDIEDIRGH